MKRKILIFISIIMIPFFILVIDHYILNDDVYVDAAYKQSADWQYITDHQSEYPKSLLQLAVRNKETLPFVADYLKQAKNNNISMSLEEDLKDHQFPFLLQWDERWGYKKYGDDMMAINGCGPTCLSMVVSYLKQDPRYNPYYLAQLAYQKGYYDSAGTAWSFMREGAELFGLQAKELSLDEESIKNALKQDHPIICSVSKGIFTSKGHFIVLREYKNGLIYVHDPNSREKSQRGYRFDELCGQIRNLWVYSRE